MLPKSPKDAPGLQLFVLCVGGVGATFQLTNNYASGFCNRSADTLFAPASASQGLQDAPGLHLLVPGVGVGTAFQLTKNSASGSAMDPLTPHLPL